jgi:hypothetical protein
MGSIMEEWSQYVTPTQPPKSNKGCKGNGVFLGKRKIQPPAEEGKVGGSGRCRPTFEDSSSGFDTVWADLTIGIRQNPFFVGGVSVPEILRTYADAS